MKLDKRGGNRDTLHKASVGNISNLISPTDPPPPSAHVTCCIELLNKNQEVKQEISLEKC